MSELIILFAVPYAAACVLFFLSGLAAPQLKRLAFLLSLLPLCYLAFYHSNWLGDSVNYAWLPALNVNFHLAFDSLSLVFIFLTAFIIPISILAAPAQMNQSNIFYGLILLLEGLLIGFFLSRDLLLFTMFYEAMLLPLFFIMALWGGAQRQLAAMRFLIYMLAGSIFMVVAILALYANAETLDIDQLSRFAPYASWIGAIFLLAFAVKTPLFPFHAWLPDTYCQASTTGTILLSALLSKAGIYGILRVGLEIFPSLIKVWSPWLLGLSIAGVLYGGLAAWSQKDYKRLLAYSSFSHVNFILAGLFVWDQTAHAGSILQAINHGLTIAALFLTAGWLEERLKTTSMGQISGLAKFMPHLCWLTFFFALSSIALPGTNNFIGELLILFGIFGQHPWWASIIATTVVLSVLYMLRYMQKVFFEAPGFFQDSWNDIKAKEFLIALPLAALILWIGVYPKPFLDQVTPAAEKILSLSEERE